MAEELHDAAWNGDLDRVHALLAAGADPRRRLRTGTQAGRTAMDLAAEHGHATVAALLVDET
jgi:ankyrin repeat protein